MGTNDASLSMKRAAWALVIMLMLGGMMVLPARAQEADELLLAVRRDFGYGGGSQIQGLFTLEASGPADLASVTFYIDETAIGEALQPPFKIQFNTDDYAPGLHTLVASGETAEGRTLTSRVRSFEFLSSGEAWSKVQSVLLGTFGLVGIVIVLIVVVQFVPAWIGRKKPAASGAPLTYGMLGGAICPKCHRPFPIHWWGLNAGFQKYDRCDHCGRWSLVSRATAEQLRAAEAAGRAAGQPEIAGEAQSAEARLKKQLEESRYQDEL
jgi:hypothetical protein